MTIFPFRGQWDFNTMFQTRDNDKFKQFLDKFRLKFGNYLEDYRVDIITKIHHFRRGYLLMQAHAEKEDIEIWGANEYIKLEDLDIMLLKTIENNARASSLHIARICNTTERSVRYRVKQFVKKYVIIGFRSALDINKLGYMYVKVQLKLNNMSKELYEKLYYYLKIHKYVIYVTESIGGSDYEFEV